MNLGNNKLELSLGLEISEIICKPIPCVQFCSHIRHHLSYSKQIKSFFSRTWFYVYSARENQPEPIRSTHTNRHEMVELHLTTVLSLAVDVTL